MIERIFLFTWLLAAAKYERTIREGSEEELDALVAETRALHDKLRRGARERA